METIEALLTRRSVRNFVPEKMPEQELIDKVVKAGTYAPSGKGKQPAVIVEITDKVVRDRLSELNARFMGHRRSSQCWLIGNVLLISTMAR